MKPPKISAAEFENALAVPVGKKWQGYEVAAVKDNTPTPNGWGGDWEQGYSEHVSIVLKSKDTFWKFEGVRDSYGSIRADFVGVPVTGKEKTVVVYEFE